MLIKLLGTTKHKQDKLYSYLPVSTSYLQELQKSADNILTKGISNKNQKDKWNQFIPNESSENIQNDLILLKLKGYIDQKDITGKSTEIKKLPKKVQVGTLIQGDPFQAVKIRNKKKVPSIIDYFLNQDKNASFSNRKFKQIQKDKQRRKKITKKSLNRKKKK